MVENKTHLEVKKGDRLYSLVCNNDSPLGELHDALCSMKAFVISKIQEADARPASEVAEECVRSDKEG